MAVEKRELRIWDVSLLSFCKACRCLFIAGQEGSCSGSIEERSPLALDFGDAEVDADSSLKPPSRQGRG